MIICGDALTELRKLEDESVHCCVTSPPYWGLRDYGVPGQLGLEATPELYVQHLVAVFREARNLLRPDGTLWLNLGDSYAHDNPSGPHGQSGQRSDRRFTADQSGGLNHGLKPKDLVGIPWRVAFALQQPYYSGKIKREQDRIWLAAMIDGEGCMFIHKRKAGQSNGQGYERKNDSYGAGLEVANCHEAIVNRCLEITGMGSICHQDKESPFKNRNQRLFRWNLRSNECRGIIREVYPHLVGKQHEARLLLGCPSSGKDAERAHAGLINLHNGFESDIDFPAPASMFEPGFYLRSDIVWKKPNPMPESVMDRPTRAHEYIFLLSKSERYYYDQEAVAEPVTETTIDRISQPNIESQAGSDRVHGKTNGPMKAVIKKQDGNGKRQYVGFNDRYFKNEKRSGHHYAEYPTRNARSVWTITTKPFKEAHFATFPPEIPERCIKAGSPVGGIVLDPFCGAGTTGMVAKQLGRDFIGIELNQKYCEMAERRIAQVGYQMELR